MLLHVEEIRALQVRISLRLPSVDGIRVDGGPNFGFGDVLFITFQDAGDRSEFSQHIRDHHVLDLELGRGVNAIDRPGTGARSGLNHDKPRLFEFGRFAIACGAHLHSTVLTLVVITTTCFCMHPQCRSVGPDLRPRQAL
jgi:hypothetical protein